MPSDRSVSCIWYNLILCQTAVSGSVVLYLWVFYRACVAWNLLLIYGRQKKNRYSKIISHIIILLLLFQILFAYFLCRLLATLFVFVFYSNFLLLIDSFHLYRFGLYCSFVLFLGRPVTISLDVNGI